jgi:hypothetical protein
MTSWGIPELDGEQKEAFPQNHSLKNTLRPAAAHTQAANVQNLIP